MQSFVIHVGIDVLRLVAWLVLLALIFVPLERFFAIASHDQPIKPSSLMAELGYYFLNSLVPTMLLAAPLALIAAIARSLLPSAWQSPLLQTPFVVKMLAALLLSEIAGYWAHRLSHEWQFLWQFHGRHHEPRHVNWLTNTHDHPVDIVWSRLASLFPVYAIGLADPTPNAHGIIPVILTIFASAWAFVIHANVRWRLGIFEQLLVTPAFHRWHHTNNEWRDHNYATLLPVLDRIFGTYHLPDHFPPNYGLDRPDELAPLFSRRLFSCPSLLSSRIKLCRFLADGQADGSNGVAHRCASNDAEKPHSAYRQAK